MKKNNKILCLMLSLIMMMSLIPATAFAAVAHSLVAEIAYAHVGCGCATVQIENGGTGGTGGAGLSVSESVDDDASRTIIINLAHGHKIANVTVNGNRVTSYTQDPTNPNQYKLDLGPITKDTSVRVYLKGSTFKVKKLDEYGNTLTGAHFVLSEINHNNPNPDITEISDTNGIAIFDNILCGTYTLSEEVAPYGYVKTDETCTVTINAADANPITIAIDPTTTASGITINTAQAAAGSAPAAFADGATIATFVNEESETKTVELKIEKTVDGATPPAGVDFDFKIERIIGEDDNGELIFDRAGGNHIRDVAPGETRTDSRKFPVSEFDKLVISEVIPNNKAGWTYDESVYKILIKTDNSGNVTGVKYSKIDTPNDQLDAAKFTNTYTEYGMDGVGHWPVGEPNDKEDHADNNQDGICDICGFNMASPNPTPDSNPTPTPGGGNVYPTPGGSTHTHTGGIHDHEDKDGDHKCDTCGKDMTPTVLTPPKTGDDSNTMLYGVLMLLALAGIVGTTVISKRKKA